MLEGPEHPLKELVRWYRTLYPIPGRLLFWLGIVLLAVSLFIWATNDNTRQGVKPKIRVIRAVQASQVI